MAVITISREFGSHGDDVAQQVADALTYHLVGQALIAQVLSQYGLVEFGHEYESIPGFWERVVAQRGQRREQIVDMLNRVVRAVAQHGNAVIVGRSGYAILQGLADVLHVRIQAPLAQRVERLMARQNLPYDQAEALVKAHDRVRTAFVEEFYKTPWDAVHAFDLVINTGKIAPPVAANWIVEAAKALDVSLPADKPTVRQLEVDPVLAAAICDLLDCRADHGVS